MTTTSYWPDTTDLLPEAPELELNALVVVTQPNGRRFLARTARAWHGEGAVYLWLWQQDYNDWCRPVPSASAVVITAPREWVTPYRRWRSVRETQVPGEPEDTIIDGLVLNRRQK